MLDFVKIVLLFGLLFIVLAVAAHYGRYVSTFPQGTIIWKHKGAAAAYFVENEEVEQKLRDALATDPRINLTPIAAALGIEIVDDQRVGKRAELSNIINISAPPIIQDDDD
jgi:hypothetical protein